jgi:hypothetical protein
LHLFPLSAIEPPESPSDLPLALWKLQIGLEILGRKKRGACLRRLRRRDRRGPAAVRRFYQGDDPGSDLCGFAVCESCFGFAGTSEKLTAMVGEAAGGTRAPVARPN